MSNWMKLGNNLCNNSCKAHHNILLLDKLLSGKQSFFTRKSPLNLFKTLKQQWFGKIDANTDLICDSKRWKK
jgi:hypothetical protein